MISFLPGALPTANTHPKCHSDQALARGGIPYYAEGAFIQRNRTLPGAISSTILNSEF
jgi:hypothetical protein